MLGVIGWAVAEPPVRVLRVVKGEAVHGLDMGLQVAFLGGAVGTVLTPERSLTWNRHTQGQAEVSARARDIVRERGDGE